MKILVVEDEPDIQEIIRAFLENSGYEVSAASDGLEAVDLFRQSTFDLILLDIMLPKIDGYAVCEIIRRESDVPVILLTALDGESDQLKGFDLLADDYVTKPFSVPLLLKRVEAVLRRSADTAREPSGILEYQNLRLDAGAHTVTVGGEPVDLTAREFELLQELLEHQGRVLTREILLGRVWNYDFMGDTRVVDTHIKNIRRKLGADYIETIRGVGYKIARMD